MPRSDRNAATSRSQTTPPASTAKPKRKASTNSEAPSLPPTSTTESLPPVDSHAEATLSHSAVVPASGASSLPTNIPPPPRTPTGLGEVVVPRTLDLKIGDKAVHPAHGVAEVTAIEHRELGGTSGLFYILRVLDNGMKVMVPTTATGHIGLRCVMSESEADAVLDTMRAREVAIDIQPWSRRFRAYTEMLKSGLPHDIAKVLRDMHRLKFDKDLSFGERRLLDQAKSLLMKELALAKKMTEADLNQLVADLFKN